MVHLREVRHWEHTFLDSLLTVWSPSTDSNMRSASSSTAKYICLRVCESVCLSVYHISILPLASDLVIRHCLGLKHNFFRQRRPQAKSSQIGQHKENMWW